MVDINKKAAADLQAYCKLIVQQLGCDWQVTVSDLESALDGADIVCASISTGGLAAMDKGHRYGVVRHLVNVIGRAVERIDDPAVFIVEARLGIAFFADEVMAGTGRQNHLADRLLRGPVGLGDQVGRPLFVHAEPPHPTRDCLGAGPGRVFAKHEIIRH